MLNEKLTRQQIIDDCLLQTGWLVSAPTQVVQEFDIIVNPQLVQEAVAPNLAHQFSNFVLLGKGDSVFAVIKAKKKALKNTIDKESAKQYCYNIQEGRGGELRKRNLIKLTFTTMHPEGIRNIFNFKGIKEIIEITQKILDA
jgi:type I restriction enzyme, R subunit